MKIIDGIKMKGEGVRIPNCKRRQLPDFFKEMGYKVGVEIGAYKGNYTRWLLKNGATIYTVDPWKEYADYGHPKVHFQARQDEIYASAKKRLSPYPNCHIIRKMSMEAVKDFKDGSIDFVYIDGHHGFKYVTEDIYEWSKKVRKGGCISGHDYASRVRNNNAFTLQVKYVVDAYTKAFKIKNWWILGRDEKLPGEHRDQYRSWLWIKE